MAEQWNIDIEDEWKSVSWIRGWEKQRGSEWDMRQKKCIYRVPYFMREARRREMFAPQVVSLGPYHHGRRDLKRMEKIKRRMLCCYLTKIHKKMEDAVRAMREEVRQLMDAYDELEEQWTNDEKGEDKFVDVMIVDACFLLLWHCIQSFKLVEAKGEDEKLIRCFMEIFPVFSSVMNDICLLENQVPTRALQILVNLAGEKFPSDINISRLFVKNLVEKANIEEYDKVKFHHKLDAVWTTQCPWGGLLLRHRRNRAFSPPSLTKLHEAGVRIEKSPSNNISFDNGVLKLPCIHFDDNAAVRYRNVMAFEKMNNLDPEFYSFMDFMDCLVDTSKDVEILRNRGIIQCGGTGMDERIASFFNRITSDMYPSPRVYRTEGEDIGQLLSEYCGSPLRILYRMFLPSFKRLYLSNPWRCTGLIAAIFLLGLTVLSTVYTVLSYYPH